MDDRGDDPAPPGVRRVVPAALAAVPAGAMVRVSVQAGGRRRLLAVGTFGGIEAGIPETAAEDPTPIRVGAVASPDVPYRAMIRAGLVAGPLGREAGLATWVRLPILHRLLHG